VQESQKILQCFGETSVEREVWAKLEAQGDRIDRFRLLVAESLLQKTDAETVAPIYQQFLERYPAIADLATANLEDLEKLLQPRLRLKRKCYS
jgi:adenine-specific DNA glycosylase